MNNINTVSVTEGHNEPLDENSEQIDEMDRTVNIEDSNNNITELKNDEVLVTIQPNGNLIAKTS